MTHQRIRIRTDIFKSPQFSLLEDEDRTDVVPFLPLSPLPLILNDKFNHIDELEVVCLGNGKDWDYNDNLSSKDLSNPNVTDIQGNVGEELQDTTQSKIASDAKFIQDMTKRIQNMKNWLWKQQEFSTSIQIVKQIVEDEKSLEEAKKRYNPALEVWLKSKSSTVRSAQPITLQNERIDFIEGGNFPNAKYILDTSARRSQEEIKATYEEFEEWLETECSSKERSVPSTITSSAAAPTWQPKFNETKRKPVSDESILKEYYGCSIFLNKHSRKLTHLQGKLHAKQAEKQEIASKNEISSREFIVITETNDGKMKQVCILCDVILVSENCIKSHLSGRRHKANYKRFSKRVR